MADLPRIRFCKMCPRAFVPKNKRHYKCPDCGSSFTIEVELPEAVVQAIRRPVFEAMDEFWEQISEWVGEADRHSSALDTLSGRAWARLQELRGDDDG